MKHIIRYTIIAIFCFFSLSGFVRLTANDAAEEPKNVLVVMEEQADLTILSQGLTKEEKGRFVFDLLTATAEDTQGPILRHIAEKGWKYQSFFIINAIKVEGISSTDISDLEALPGVAYVQHDNPVKLTDVRIKPSTFPGRETEWGLLQIGADQVWDMGYTGQGAVVAGQDTGYDWSHPAIKSRYRGFIDTGTSAEHDYNWHDAIHDYSELHDTQVNPCGLDVVVPCDDNGHGTHTMGTMVGGTEGDAIGVAPGAKWIACRNMERGWGSPSSYIECYEFFLAPTDLQGENPLPEKAPHVINNSWSCPEIEGCNTSNFETMRMVIDNLKTAGIVVVVSAGNAGPECSTINTPSAIFENSFSIGASDDKDSLAWFSSRGPVAIDGSMRIKPNVSAPGVNVRSCFPDDRYGTASGTSMAGPHVAGVVALMISANPALAGNVERIETILEQTATPLHEDNDCGSVDQFPMVNYLHGFGRIDAKAAVEAAIADAYPINLFRPTVYPNPSDDVFHFVFPEEDDEYIFEIWNSEGRLMRQEKIKSNVNRVTLDLSAYKSGLYYYRITKNDTSWTGTLFRL